MSHPTSPEHKAVLTKARTRRYWLKRRQLAREQGHCVTCRQPSTTHQCATCLARRKRWRTKAPVAAPVPTPTGARFVRTNQGWVLG